MYIICFYVQDRNQEHYPFTLPSQSQLEDNLRSRLAIHEGIEENREPGGGELQFEDENHEGLGKSERRLPEWAGLYVLQLLWDQ